MLVPGDDCDPLAARMEEDSKKLSLDLAAKRVGGGGSVCVCVSVCLCVCVR